MIWLSISLLLCAILICCTIIILHLSDRAYSNAICCLEDLCDTLNEKFPGSNLTIINILFHLQPRQLHHYEYIE